MTSTLCENPDTILYYPEDFNYSMDILNQDEYRISKIKWVIDNKLTTNERTIFLTFTHNYSNYAKTSRIVKCSIPTLRKYISLIRTKIISNL